ncbi:MAG: Rieske 2Fe-2S domain-containing protein [Myxococcales bacterium]|nr:Rieske 2Fe-2S domain-containing protein [Myxococcales bacterium]
MSESTHDPLASFPGFPRGWFVIQFSDELAPGEVKPLRYFGKDFVLFRTESGEPAILDAFCPHLGAHLGYGGKVKGDEIECPFHAWRFDGRGKCTAVPYATKVPPKAKIGAHHVVEKNGMIYLWHDRDGYGPDWEVPDLPEYDLAHYLEWNHSIIEIATHPREIVENLVDTGHFMPVHGTRAEKFRNEFRGHVGVQYNEGVAYPLGGGEDHYALTATYYGPAYMVVHMKGVLESIIINSHTPIEEGRLHLRFAVSLKHDGNIDRTSQFVAQYIDNLRRGYLQDVAIWENKVFRERPILCDGDGDIGALRRWYRQFYEPREPFERQAAE